MSATLVPKISPFEVPKVAKFCFAKHEIMSKIVEIPVLLERMVDLPVKREYRGH